VCTVTNADGSTYEYATPGFVEVAPSPNKTWMRSPMEHRILPVPDEVARKLHETRRSSEEPAPKRRRLEAKASAEVPTGRSPAGRGPRGLRPLVWRACVEPNMPCLAKMGFDAARMFDVHEYGAAGANMAGAGYVNGVVQFKLRCGPCPLCAKPDGHQNAYWLGVRADGSRRVMNHSRSCAPGGRRVAVLVPWTAAGRARWVEQARRAGAPVNCADAARLSPSFAEARFAFLLRGCLYVCKAPSLFYVVQLGLPARYGYPSIGQTAEPWLEALPKPFGALPLDLGALRRLLRAGAAPPPHPESAGDGSGAPPSP